MKFYDVSIEFGNSIFALTLDIKVNFLMSSLDVEQEFLRSEQHVAA